MHDPLPLPTQSGHELHFCPVSADGCGGVQAFVAFADAESAAKAKAAIHGRLFAGITVQVFFISQEHFAAISQASA